MDADLDDQYFNWLCAKVVIPEGGSATYYQLLKILHDTEFVWVISGDDNRVADAADLRQEFAVVMSNGVTPASFDPGAGVLEVLIAFSRRAEFQTDVPAAEWFWRFVTTLNLGDFYDPLNSSDRNKINRRLRAFIWRTYAYDGRGGLFPMGNPPEDQRKVELWYQFCEYLVDQGVF